MTPRWRGPSVICSPIRQPPAAWARPGVIGSRPGTVSGGWPMSISATTMSCSAAGCEPDAHLDPDEPVSDSVSPDARHVQPAEDPAAGAAASPGRHRADPLARGAGGPLAGGRAPAAGPAGHLRWDHGGPSPVYPSAQGLAGLVWLLLPGVGPPDVPAGAGRVPTRRRLRPLGLPRRLGGRPARPSRGAPRRDSGPRLGYPGPLPLSPAIARHGRGPAPGGRDRRRQSRPGGARGGAGRRSEPGPG